MKKIGKYEFNNKTTADAKISALEESGHTFVSLGNIIIVDAEYDAEGNETVPAVKSVKHHVDVLWVNLNPVDSDAEVLQYTHPDGWADYAADVDDDGVHSFLGLSYADYKF